MPYSELLQNIIRRASSLCHLAHVTPLPGSVLPSSYLQSKVSCTSYPLIVVENHDSPRYLHFATIDGEDITGAPLTDHDAKIEAIVQSIACYNNKAQRPLTNHGLAPSLHAFSPLLAGLNAIITDLIPGVSAWEFQQNYYLSRREKSNQHTPRLNLVFGDLQPCDSAAYNSKILCTLSPKTVPCGSRLIGLGSMMCRDILRYSTMKYLDGRHGLAMVVSWTRRVIFGCSIEQLLS